MRIVSVNVGLPREIEWGDKRVLTSIFKASVATRVAVLQQRPAALDPRRGREVGRGWE